MITKIFLTGATGYIGGDALAAIATAHPDYQITALVRNSDKGAKVAAAYPSVRLVYGDLDSTDLLTTEASKADIVARTSAISHVFFNLLTISIYIADLANADHEDGAQALVKGLSAREQPSFLIHTSGTGILLHDDFERLHSFGERLGEKVYNDLEGVTEVTSLDDAAPHRRVDKIVLAAGPATEGRVHTAIVCPPTIYGEGRGPDNRRSHQVPELCRVSLQQGHGIRVNDGKTYWGNVHVHDLSALYVLLIEEAAAGGSTAEWPEKPATWGPEGYFFVEDGEHVWGDVSQWVAEEAHKQGFLKADEVRAVTAEQAGELTPWGQALWGANSRAQAKRARSALKWQPRGPPLKDTIAATVTAEALALGLKPGHAEIAAGDR